MSSEPPPPLSRLLFALLSTADIPLVALTAHLANSLLQKNILPFYLFQNALHFSHIISRISAQQQIIIFHSVQLYAVSKNYCCGVP